MNYHQHRGSRQPLGNLDNNPTEPSYRPATPNQKNVVKNNTQTSEVKSQLNYNIQYKVGGQKQLQQRASRINENQPLFMSPIPDRKNQQQQQSTQHQQNLYRSPMQRNVSQAHVVQSPIHPQPNKNRGIAQNPVSYTTTFKIQQELFELKEVNIKLQQKSQTLETEINRTNSTTFIKELQQKISLLEQLNLKLHKDNEKLIEVMNVDKLKQTIQEQQQQKQQLEIEYQDIIGQFEQWDIDKMTLDNEELQNEDYLSDLIIELENKIQGLIIENEKLNIQMQENENTDEYLSSIELDIQKHQYDYQKLKQDESQYKLKHDQLKLEMSKKSIPKNSDSKQKEKMEKQIEQLQQQNKSLQELVGNQRDFEEEIRDLEDRIQIIAQDNKKLEKQLDFN